MDRVVAQVLSWNLSGYLCFPPLKKFYSALNESSLCYIEYTAYCTYKCGNTEMVDV